MQFEQVIITKSIHLQPNNIREQPTIILNMDTLCDIPFINLLHQLHLGQLVLVKSM